MATDDTNIAFLAKLFAIELWSRRWLALGVAALLCLVGSLVVAALPDRYTSTARVYIDTQSLINPLMKGLTVQPDLEQQVDIMRRTLLSRPNVANLIRVTDLDLTVDSDVARERLIERLQQQISVQAQQAQLFLVSYEDTDPDLAQRVVQGVLSIFLEQSVGDSRQDMERSRRFIEGQIADYEARLREAEARVAAFKRDHADELGSRDAISANIQTLQTELERLKTELEASVWNRDQLKAELARTPKSTTSRVGSGSPSTAAARVAELQEKLNQLLLRYTDQHPDVIATRKALEAAQAEVKAGGAAAPSAPTVSTANATYTQIQDELRKNEIEANALQRRIESVQNDLLESRRRLADVPQVELQLAQMDRDYEVLRKNYSELIQRREAAKIANDLDNQTTGIDFRVVDPPVVPLTPSGPKRLLLFAGVLLGSIAAGVGIVFVLRQLRDSFATVEQLKEAFGLPILGSVCLVRGRLHRHLVRAEALAFACSCAVLGVAFAAVTYLFTYADRPQWLASVLRVVGTLPKLVS